MVEEKKDKIEKKTGILGVSRVISNETLDVLYGRDIFVVQIQLTDARLLRKFGVANLRRIRYLRIVAQPCKKKHAPDGVRSVFLSPKIWRPLLRGLVQLCIVAGRQYRHEAPYWCERITTTEAIMPGVWMAIAIYHQQGRAVPPSNRG